MRKIRASVVKRSAEKQSAALNSQLGFRVDKDLKERFIIACKANGSTAAKTLIAFMGEYLKEYGD